ncbi:MAG: nucleotidyltransferase [Sedimentisphaerales bacterium]|nr:nucleotidyltransferase [Sedimentisphaerales bacterium]
MLNEDYRDMLRALSDHEVRFLLVGAYAMAAHGYPRATGDIDIWVEPTAENSRRVYRALAAFGAPVRELDETAFAQKGTVFQIGVEPRRIDIISAVSGVEFEQAYPQRRTVDLEGLVIPVVSFNDLVKNKRATGRDKDRIDVKRLEKRSG